MGKRYKKRLRKKIEKKELLCFVAREGLLESREKGDYRNFVTCSRVYLTFLKELITLKLYYLEEEPTTENLESLYNTFSDAS